MTSTPTRFGFALAYVTDIQAAKQFYVDVLGMQVAREAPVFVQFKDPTGTPFAIASDESLGGTSETELYWLVDDAEAAYADFSQKAEVSLSLRELPFGKVFGIKDPSGHPVYVVQLATNRPSRPAK